VEVKKTPTVISPSKSRYRGYHLLKHRLTVVFNESMRDLKRSLFSDCSSALRCKDHLRRKDHDSRVNEFRVC